MNMYRNLFAVFATIALGAGAASASTATTDSQSQSLEQRVLAAQKSIGAAINAAEQPAAKADSNKVAQYYWRNYHFRNNFPNYFRNYYGG
jgi:hypothetical protein